MVSLKKKSESLIKYYIKVTCALKWARKLPRKTETYESAKCVPCNTRKYTHNGFVSDLLKWALKCRFYATGPRCPPYERTPEGKVARDLTPTPQPKFPPKKILEKFQDMCAYGCFAVIILWFVSLFISPRSYLVMSKLFIHLFVVLITVYWLPL